MPGDNESDANPSDEVKTNVTVNNVRVEVPRNYKIDVEDVLSDSEDEEKGSDSHNTSAYDGEPIVMFDSISVVNESNEDSDDHLKEVAKIDSIHIPARKKLLELFHKDTSGMNDLICGACNDNHSRDGTSPLDVQYHTDDEKMTKVPKVTPTPDQKKRLEENRRRALEIRKEAKRKEVKDGKPTAKRSLLPELLNMSRANTVENPYLKKKKKNMYRVNECSTRLIYQNCACRAAIYIQSWCPACHQKINLGDCITKHQYWHHTECPFPLPDGPPEDWHHTECPFSLPDSPPDEKVIPGDLEESIKDGSKSTGNGVPSHIGEHTSRDQAKAVNDKDKYPNKNRSTSHKEDNQQHGVSLARDFILPDNSESHVI
jgi:hypothetical protein